MLHSRPSEALGRDQSPIRIDVKFAKNKFLESTEAVMRFYPKVNYSIDNENKIE